MKELSRISKNFTGIWVKRIDVPASTGGTGVHPKLQRRIRMTPGGLNVRLRDDDKKAFPAAQIDRREGLLNKRGEATPVPNHRPPEFFVENKHKKLINNYLR